MTTDERKREQARERKRAQRARAREAGTTIASDERTAATERKRAQRAHDSAHGETRTAIALAFDAAFANERRAYTARGRTLVTAPHTCAEHGEVLFIDTRPPRGDAWRARTVARDRTWSTASEATPVRPCRHKRGHTAKHTHGAPQLTAWRKRVIALAATLTPGHDPSWAERADTLAELAAISTFTYAPRDCDTAPTALAWAERRRAHVEGTWEWAEDERGYAVRVRVEEACADCRHGYALTSYNSTRRDTSHEERNARESALVRATAPTLDRFTTAAERRAHARERASWRARFDARMEERERDPARRARAFALRFARDGYAHDTFPGGATITVTSR